MCMFPVLKGRLKGNDTDYSNRAVRYDQLKLSSRVLDRLNFVRLVKNCVTDPEGSLPTRHWPLF